jgi:hypothetical protein
MAEEPVLPSEQEPKGESQPLPEHPLEQAPESLQTPEQTEQRAEGGTTEQTEKYQNLLQQVGGASVPADDTHHDAQEIGALESEEQKVDKLLDLATTKGLPHAVSVARKMKDYYVLDRMHDDLVDKLYDELVAKGLIQKG